MAKHSTKAAGIDTGKHKLDVALSCGEAVLQVANNEAGYGELCNWLRRHRVKRIGIEASGGYERDVVAWLRGRGHIVIIFQPLQVRAYAQFHLKRAKNDRIDAGLIALCAADSKQIREPSDPRLAAFKERLRLIEQIEEDASRMKTRLEGYRDKSLISRLKAEIKRLCAWRRSALKALFAELALHADLHRKIELLSSIDGVGPRTALAMLVHMPELGTLTREEAASLGGLAPFDHDSAQRRGQRHIFGGRRRLRRSLYAAALPAAFHWNNALMALYKRLTAAGKPHKVALVACARKLIIYANAVLERGTPWAASAQAG
ncbi:MAG TPA: IS110 family transposase [Rhizomicrobium sp.]|nr:IS110 family transposase [Rhizomicrobium sp.]